MARIGFIGLGSMGMPMARNLLKTGFKVQGFDVRTESVTALEEAGGVGASSAGHAASGADLLVLMVVNAAQAEAALFEGGALDSLRRGAVVVLMATCPPADVEDLARRVEDAGRRFVDAPVSGGVVGATAGTLTIMAAAPSAVLAEVRPVLEALGDKVFRFCQISGQLAESAPSG
jgi:putative dehydrogenase